VTVPLGAQDVHLASSGVEALFDEREELLASAEAGSRVVNEKEFQGMSV
jgi:hypothetical protein